MTAGIDFGLTLLATLRGEEVAKMTQLMMEYDPKPPFNTGTPETAGPELTATARAVMQMSLDQGLAIASKAVRRAKDGFPSERIIRSPLVLRIFDRKPAWANASIEKYHSMQDVRRAVQLVE